MSIATYEDFQRRTANGRNTFSFANTFDRLAPFPLEKYSIFPDYETAKSYVAGEGDYDGLAYEGQVITVKEDGKQVVYVVDASATDGLRKSGADINPEDIGAADANHTHPISEVDGLETRLQQIESSSGGGGSIMYTVNGQSADNNGNFTITTDSINAAETIHTHAMTDVVNLTTTLDTKSNVNHTHAMVTSINVNNEELSGNVQLIGERNVEITQELKNNSESQITVGITPYTSDTTESIIDSNLQNTSYKFFVGTKTEWDDFKATISNNENYIVFLRS